MEHHRLDIYPIPRENEPMFSNEASEKNEFNFSQDVDALISQIEIYDQIWFVHHMPSEGKHSAEAVELVKEFVAQLEEVPDACAERFPFDTINELKRKYIKSFMDLLKGKYA